MSDFTITDFDDRTIKVGTTVRMWWDAPVTETLPRGAPGCTCGTPPFAPPEASDDCPYHGTGERIFGVVQELGEWEGDVDSEGRSIGIPPRVTVTWENGTQNSFVTSEWEWNDDGFYREPEVGKVEELDVVQGPLRNEVVHGR